MDSRVTAPIPARLARVLAVPGAVVTKGMPLVVLEAMKMELTLAAPRDGTVSAVRHGPGDMVEEGAELVTFALDSRKRDIFRGARLPRRLFTALHVPQALGGTAQ